MQIPKINLEGDDVKKMRSLLKIYSIVVFNEIITERESQVLSEYILYGVNDRAFKAITLNYQMNDNSRKQVDTRLQKKGLLKFKTYKRGRELHEELENFRKTFVEDKNKFLLLQIWT